MPKQTGIHFEVFVDSSAQYRWRMVDGNNRIVGTGGEGYTRWQDAQRAVENVVNDLSSQTDTPVITRAKNIRG
jgi:uncharacterized protein YegP (UPF0339 family)